MPCCAGGMYTSGARRERHLRQRHHWCASAGTPAQQLSPFHCMCQCFRGMHLPPCTVMIYIYERSKQTSLEPCMHVLAMLMQSLLRHRVRQDCSLCAAAAGAAAVQEQAHRCHLCAGAHPHAGAGSAGDEAASITLSCSATSCAREICDDALIWMNHHILIL